MTSFESLLTGGHPNSLGNTLEVVDRVLADKTKLDELYRCYFSEDEVVRLRTSSAMKRICIAHPDWMVPYLDRLIDPIAKIDQASTQWTLAILFDLLKVRMTENQLKRAKKLLKYNLAHQRDWIVLNTTMDTLGKWAQQDDPDLKKWMLPQLTRLQNDTRKSVKHKAQKTWRLINES